MSKNQTHFLMYMTKNADIYIVQDVIAFKLLTSITCMLIYDEEMCFAIRSFKSVALLYFFCIISNV